MPITGEMIISGFVSKIVSDIVDIPENPIKKSVKDADKKRRDKNQSIETRIYQVTIDAIKAFTKREYKGQDVLYDAAESIIIGFKNSNNSVETVRSGLKMLGLQVTSETCEEFLKTLHHVICIDKNDILYKQIILIQGEQTFETVREGFDESNKNDEKTHKKLDYVIEGIDNINEKIDGIENNKVREYGMLIKNGADEYAKKWDENVFLNNFNEEDENAGINIKLREIYVEECLPHYIWKNNTKTSDKLRNLLTKYIINNNDRKMLLILGQPGIGKSTLITWIMANLVVKKDQIFVYQFASDLDSIDWQDKNVLNNIFSIIESEHDKLDGKTLILDGFDEIYIDGDRERVLNKFNQELKCLNTLKSFSLIITCRENYIYNPRDVKCDYIVLQAWEETQIEIFCKTYWRKCKKDILESNIKKIQENKEIFGIPLVLYIILALDISVEKSSSIVDIYDKIFSLERGVIYDRCYDSEHRLNDYEMKKSIHQISQRMAFWIFENNANKAYIYQKNFREICDVVLLEREDQSKDIQRDTLIGSYFKIKHCEGKMADELSFIHRSIYEYFVAIYFFESTCNLTSIEELAGRLGELLKRGVLSEQILEYIKYKFDRINYNNLSDVTKEVFQIMLQDGMTYFGGRLCKNVVELEMKIFFNMLRVVHLWNSELGKLDDKLNSYLRHNNRFVLDLEGVILNGATLYFVNLYASKLNESSLINARLNHANLSTADLTNAKLMGADLRQSNLSNAKLCGTDLTDAKLIKADLSETDLSRANLSGAALYNANLRETIFNEQQIDILYKKYNLSKSRVFISETNEIMDYEDYCVRRKMDKKE